MPGSALSHVMEDCLVSAQEGRLYLRPEHIDALLQGTDLLMRIATPNNSLTPVDIEAYVALMAQLLDPLAPAAPTSMPVMAERQLRSAPRRAASPGR